MYCNNCGNKLNQGEIFCSNCGTRIQSEVINNQGINKKTNNKLKKILSGLIILSIIIIILILLFSKPNNSVVGIWDCKPFNSGQNQDLEFIITMELHNDNKFKWNKYNDANDNYVIGKYEFEDLHKTNHGNTAKYYSIKLMGEEYVSEGILQDEEYESKYEMGILNDSNEAILMNIHTYNMYYCFRR